MADIKTASVFAAIVGVPNVGKSSLLNALVGERLAIITPKPQTTRTKITGILTKGAIQFVFTDTPGFHSPRTKLGERMVKSVNQSIADVDVAVFVFEAFGDITAAEQKLLEQLKAGSRPAIAVINKIDAAGADKIENKTQAVKACGIFDTVLHISAKEGTGVDELLNVIEKYASEGPHFFDDDSITDMPEKVIVGEIVREKLLINLFEELPHGTAVEVESFKEREGAQLIDIGIIIYCEKKSHKGMIIGKAGAMLKKIASEARADIEAFLQAKVNLQCWVKIKEDWRDSDFLLNSFGFKQE